MVPEERNRNQPIALHTRTCIPVRKKKKRKKTLFYENFIFTLKER